MARRTKEDAEKTREALLDAAEMVFMEKGVAATSLDDIARHAHLTRGAIYWHFDNKQALFDAMHARVQLPMDALFERAQNDEDPLQALRALCVYALQNIAGNERARRVYTILLLKCEQGGQNVGSAERQDQKRHEIIDGFARVFRHAITNGQIGPGLDALAIAIAFHAYITGIFNDFLRYPAAYDIQKLAPTMVALFFDGIRPGNVAG